MQLTETERDGEIFHLLACSPNSLSGWGWVRSKLRTRNPIQVREQNPRQGSGDTSTAGSGLVTCGTTALAPLSLDKVFHKAQVLNVAKVQFSMFPSMDCAFGVMSRDFPEPWVLKVFFCVIFWKL